MHQTDAKRNRTLQRTLLLPAHPAILLAGLVLMAALPLALPGGILSQARAQSQAVWQCLRCGQKNPGGKTTCSRCGAKAPSSPAKAGNTGSKPKQRSQKPADGSQSNGPQWKCPQCSAANPIYKKNTCSQCGTKVNLQFACPHCGKSVAVGKQLCPHCSGQLPQFPDPPGASPAEATKAKPAKPKKELTESQKAHIRSIAEFYTKTYSEHLKNRDWFIRALAVVGLSKLQSDSTTELLLDTLKSDRDSLVRVYAWEALHARSDTLNDDQRFTWVKEGIDTALMKDGFRGDLRAGLVRAMAPYGSDGFGGRASQVVYRYIKETDHREPNDHHTLKALRDLVAQWQDPTVTRRLVMQMTQDGPANRVEYVLGELNPQIEAIGRCETRIPQGTWLQKRAEWVAWLKDATLQARTVKDLTPYKGTSSFLPHSQEITNPNDPTWREELEVDKLQINAFDLVFVVDSTGSMAQVMAWLARDLSKILSAMKLYAREPRIGVVYYRHEVESSLMQPCCNAAPKGATNYQATDYRVKCFPLTGRIRKLAQAMQAEKAGGAHANPAGHAIRNPGAVHGGLVTAISKQPWTKSSLSRKIIVLAGDAPPTEGTMPAIKKLLDKATEAGLRVNVLKVLMLPQYIPPKRLGLSPAGQKTFSDFDKIATWGQGRSMIGQFLNPPPTITGQIAPPPKKQFSPSKMLIAQIIRSTLPDGYQQRVDPLVEVLVEYTDAVPPKKRR